MLFIEDGGGRTPSANATALAGTSKTNGRSSTDNSIPSTNVFVNDFENFHAAVDNVSFFVL